MYIIEKRNLITLFVFLRKLLRNFESLTSFIKHLIYKDYYYISAFLLFVIRTINYIRMLRRTYHGAGVGIIFFIVPM